MQRVRHDSASKPPPPPFGQIKVYEYLMLRRVTQRGGICKSKREFQGFPTERWMSKEIIPFMDEKYRKSVRKAGDW